MGEATDFVDSVVRLLCNFNPRFPWGKRPVIVILRPLPSRFQSTLPVGEATFLLLEVILHHSIISIHASRGGSDRLPPASRSRAEISIHASRGGSDLALRIHGKDAVVISIHASRGGSDDPRRHRLRRTHIFQSTLPVGEATLMRAGVDVWMTISIHASRGGSDHPPLSLLPPHPHFNPRFPWGKRQQGATRRCTDKHFNPRFPWGKRLRISQISYMIFIYFMCKFYILNNF